VHGAPAAFARALEGERVEGVIRRGKRLRIALGDGTLLFSHLGMSGSCSRGSTRASSTPRSLAADARSKRR
jgi:formamidopyrimidine-DNA glycosylase